MKRICRHPIPKKSVLVSWLFSYFIIIAVCIALSSAVYWEAEFFVRDTVNHSNEILLRQVQQSIDSRLQDIKTLAYQLSADKNVSNMLMVKEPLSGSDWYSVRQVVQDFQMLKKSDNYLDFFYISVNSVHLFVGDDGSYSGNVLYDQYIKDSGISYSDWLAMHSRVNAGEFVPLYKSNANPARRTVAYQESLLFNDSERSATLVLLFDEGKLFNAIKNINIVDSSTVFIIDQGGDLITSSGKPIASHISYSSLPVSGVVTRKLDGCRMVLSCVKSEENDWKYVIAVPDKVYGAKIRSMRTITYVIFGTCVSLSGLLALMFARRHYNPVRDILRVTAAAGGPGPVRTGEFDFIRDYIQSNQSQKELYYKGWAQHRKELQNNFLKRLLQGETDRNLSDDDMLANYDIHFASTVFAVLLYGVEDYSQLFGKEEYDAIDHVKFAVSNVAEEVAGERNIAYMVDCGDTLACLVNFRTNQPESNEKELDRIADVCARFFDEKLKIKVTIGISSVHKGAGSIWAAYRQAIEALEYRIVKGSGIVIHSRDISPTRSRYSYSIETECLLINSIKAGDYGRAILKLDEIFDQNFSQSHMPTEMVRCFMFGLINTMIQTMDEISPMCDNSFLDSLSPVIRLLGCKSLDAMRHEMHGLLRQICDEIVRSREKSQNNGLKEKILDYLNAHYQEPSLSISSIADEFHISPISLSHFFKDQSGETLLDTIHSIRLKKAKELMKEGLSIVQVAEKVGYGNSDTFIRNFKKYEGTTPGKYKNLYGGL